MEDQKQGAELQRFYNQLLSPLSLLPRRETPQKLHPEVSRWQTVPLAKLTVASLCKQVARQLASSGLTARVSPKDRFCLTEVILNELKCSWQEPPAEPSLSYGNNQKLRKRLETYVLLSSEQLFLRYLHLLMTMSTPRGVFTESAILTRLSAGLARDCTIFLTSPNVYRCLLKDFQALLKVEQTPGNLGKLRPICPIGTFKFCPIPWPHSTGFGKVPCSSLTLNYLVQLSRPPEFFREPEWDPVKELKSNPELKREKHLRWLLSLRKDRAIDLGSSQMMSLPSHSVTPTTSAVSPLPFPLYFQLQRGQSMPSIRDGWMLADELGLPPLSTRPLTPLVLAPESKPELTRDIVAEDLKQKMKNMNWEWAHYSPLDSGLPRLLGAVTCRPGAEYRMAELKKTLKRLQEEEDSEQQSLQLPKSSPLQQPVTMTLKLRNQAVVQPAVMLLSERNFLDSFCVEGAGVLYNHLAGELDSKAIEEMDADYYVASSIKEVYKELTSCVSTDHLCFDKGPLIEATANKDLSTCLSSAFLRQKKQFQIINPHLARLYSQKTNTLESSSEKKASHTSIQGTKDLEKQSNKPAGMSWWKNFSVDDYLKYLTDKETDFLHVIFQMYEEEVPVEVTAPVKESLEIQHPPALVEDEETDFVPGKWDWNTVLQYRLQAGKPNILSLQKRLEQLWSMLEVPNKIQLDMVIKYSSDARLQQLPLLVKAWEQAIKSIRLREVLLRKLEGFERQASDPNRFFQKTDLDLNHLLEQDQFRSYVHKQLSQMEPPLVSLLEEIELIFGEPVTFKGRRYLDKMKRDKVEMLYWLQQQRRVRNLIQAHKVSLQSAQFRSNSSRPLLAPGNSPTNL